MPFWAARPPTDARRVHGDSQGTVLPRLEPSLGVVMSEVVTGRGKEALDLTADGAEWPECNRCTFNNIQGMG